jgi:hypothetical protein
MNPDLYNSILRVKRQQVTGTEDGTPVTAPVLHDVAGWFDEVFLQTRAVTAERGGTSGVNTTPRRALFACDADSILAGSDEGEVLIGGTSQGRWTVEKVETAAIPGGFGHLEATLLRIEEGR